MENYKQWMEQKLTSEDMEKLPKVQKPLSKEKIIAILKEKYLIEECKKRGWNINLLSTGQLLFIVSTPEYKAIK